MPRFTLLRFAALLRNDENERDRAGVADAKGAI